MSEMSFDTSALKFNADGLIPAIAQHADTGKVLMLAYMNRESLAATLETRLATFWSRSRSVLWVKGETSGNHLHVLSISADCDGDTLLLRVSPDGPACHTGQESCFFNSILPEQEEEQEAFSIDGLYRLIEGRKSEKKEGSYTTYLFEKGIDKILKKVGEESTEVIIAGKAGDKKETVYEISDLCYHVLVLMVELGISPGDIIAELASRHVIDKKVKQEKMTQ